MFRLFDTATSQVRPLALREPGKVGIYLCGPTVYGPPHLGHGRATLVYDILREVNRSDGYSNLLLPQALTATNFEQRDKGFATELLYGTLRMQGRHDYIASQVSDRPWSEVDDGIVDLEIHFSFPI
jgi:hypothetical protein